ncbi:hypothetical protein TNCT_645151 [Trichonephila clavata]|uniref:Uncharacterized protein n=1 Tax=Trichonephila clavata TaxID=2740835 RepID=A0A8X6GJV3_TRICU|nr:hypothetical protein TNCT_645151 [Trichonephila clavata]
MKKHLHFVNGNYVNNTPFSKVSQLNYEIISNINGTTYNGSTEPSLKLEPRVASKLLKPPELSTSGYASNELFWLPLGQLVPLQEARFQ